MTNRDRNLLIYGSLILFAFVSIILLLLKHERFELRFSKNALSHPEGDPGLRSLLGVKHLGGSYEVDAHYRSAGILVKHFKEGKAQRGHSGLFGVSVEEGTLQLDMLFFQDSDGSGRSFTRVKSGKMGTSTRDQGPEYASTYSSYYFARNANIEDLISFRGCYVLGVHSVTYPGQPGITLTRTSELEERLAKSPEALVMFVLLSADPDYGNTMRKIESIDFSIAP